jgi:hypothetical protein
MTMAATQDRACSTSLMNKGDEALKRLTTSATGRFCCRIGIPTARDGRCIFLKPSIVTRWIVRATYARLY